MKKIKASLKYIAIYSLRIFLNVFNVFPIKNNRVLFYSFNGKQYSCNPRCISDSLLDSDLDIIWAFKNPSLFKESVSSKISIVRFRSLRYYYFAKTSRVVVFNVQGYGELSRRKGQVFIQTWHASNGYKKVGNFVGIERKLNLLGHKDYSYVMSGSDSMTKRRIRGSMGFNGPVISGTPRMDEIINNKSCSRLEVLKAFDIPSENKVLVYAPTWRSDRSGSDADMDYKALYDALRTKLPLSIKI